VGPDDEVSRNVLAGAELVSAALAVHSLFVATSTTSESRRAVAEICAPGLTRPEQRRGSARQEIKPSVTQELLERLSVGKSECQLGINRLANDESALPGDLLQRCL